MVRNFPKSVSELLERIELSQYEHLLNDAGWDDLDYLDFTDSDLIEAGINDEGDRQIVSCSYNSKLSCLWYWLIKIAWLSILEVCLIPKRYL